MTLSHLNINFSILSLAKETERDTIILEEWLVTASFLLCRSQNDPIYFCALLMGCFAMNNGDATILSLNVTPNSVPQGNVA